jgi:hypothetical protein
MQVARVAVFRDQEPYAQAFVDEAVRDRLVDEGHGLYWVWTEQGVVSPKQGGRSAKVADLILGQPAKTGAGGPLDLTLSNLYPASRDVRHQGEEATVSVPIIHRLPNVVARVDRVEFDRWIELGRPQQWEYSEDGIIYRTERMTFRVADTILGAPARYRDGSIFNLTRANLIPA